MNKLDVELSISTRYVDDFDSVQTRILMNSGVVHRGIFIKANQKGFNSMRNKWIITIGYLELLVDGNEIDSFFPSKRQAT